MFNRLNEIDHIESFIGIHTSGKQRHNVHFNRALLKCQDEKSILFYSIGNYVFCLNFRKKEGRKKFQLTKINPKITAFFYGEMYNFGELCIACGIGKADWKNISFSALCSILYQKYGLRFASKINGIFSIVLIDGDAEKLYLFADRFGSARPIYYYISDKMIFSNQLKLLIKIPEINKVIDEQSMALFLKYSYVPAPRTMIKGIKKLRPGEVAIFAKEFAEKKRYTSFEPPEQTILDERKAIGIYREKLKFSVWEKMQTHDKQKIGFFLSGGLDSSANLACAAKNDTKNFETFGVGFENPNFDERQYASMLATHFGVKFNDYLFTGSELDDLPRMIWFLEEPFMENGLFLTYAAFKSINGKADIIIAGDGADQLFGTGGFADGRPIALRYLFDKLKIRKLFNFLLNHVINSCAYKDNILFKIKVMLDRAVSFNDWFFWGFDNRELKRLCKFPISNTDLQIFQNNVPGHGKTFAEYYEFSRIHQDIEHYASQNLLVKSYRMADLFGVRLRESYLDNNVADCIASLGINLKIKGTLLNFLKGDFVSKYLHRLVMNDLLPDNILKKSKQGGFIPMSLLLKNAQRRNTIFKYILNSQFLQRYMDISYIKVILKRYEESISKPVYWQVYQDCNANQIMNLLALSLWNDIVFSNPQKKPEELSLSAYISDI
jgi:asparagine synthase (glutamine-hydrolysing)